MMRDFTAAELVALPRMKARELLAIARAMVLRAHGIRGLERPLTEALSDVEAQVEALASEMATPPKKLPAVPLKVADMAECNAVGAVVDFAASWTRLPEGECAEEVATARACVEVFREDGTLEFLKYKPLVKHSEVQRRIDLLAARGLDEKLRGLGGGAFLDHLDRTHAIYGEAVSANASDGETESPAIGSKASELSEALKTYVVRVVSTVDRKRAETRQRADSLLAPLRAWNTSPNASAESSDEDPAKPTPQPAPQPDVTRQAPANDAAPARKVG